MSSQASSNFARSEGVRTERETRSIVVKRHDAVIASSNRALIVHGVLEAPVYYVPQEDVYMEHLTESDEAGVPNDDLGRRFFSVVASGGGVANAAWIHGNATAGTNALRDHVGFDPAVFSVTAG
jgi:uncharacterized protein (DUF427 family)